MTGRLAAFLRRQPRALLTLLGMASIALLAFIDWVAPPDRRCTGAPRARSNA